MIKFYYTGAVKYLDVQTKPKYSLGGFISSSEIPNAVINNMFSSLSQFTLQNVNDSLTIGIVIKNLGEINYNNVCLYFNYPENNYTILKVAAVTVLNNGNGCLYMEKIPQMRALPVYATFYEADGFENRVNLGDLPANTYIGLWLNRTLKADLENQIDCSAMKTLYDNNIELATKEAIELKIEWEEEGN